MKKVLIGLLTVGIAFTAMQPAQACPSTDTQVPVVQAPLAPVVAPVEQVSVVQETVAPVVTEPVVAEPVTQAPAALLSQPAQAEDQKVLAIIDTAIDSNKVASVVHEVCFTDAKDMSCPNGELFMEGKGAAGSKAWPTSIHNATYHGHNMAQVALSVDADVKIVFVRVANITALGNSGVTAKTLSLGMEWVSNNAAKYGIDAVSISQASISKNNLDACVGTGVLKDDGLRAINAVSLLSLSNITVFAGTGNNSKAPTTIAPVAFPACINQVIGVGAVKPNLTELASYTNRGLGLDLIASGAENIVNYRGTSVTITGTSVATAYAAASYVKNRGSSTFIDFSNRLLNVLGLPHITK